MFQSSIEIARLNLRPNVMYFKGDESLEYIARTAEHNFRSIGSSLCLEVRAQDGHLMGVVSPETGRFSPAS